MEQDFRLIVHPNTYLSSYYDRRSKALFYLERYVENRILEHKDGVINEMYCKIKSLKEDLIIDPNISDVRLVGS